MRVSRITIARALLDRASPAQRVRFALDQLALALDAPSLAAVRWALESACDPSGARISTSFPNPNPKDERT